MIDESRSILNNDQSSKTKGRYAFKKLDLVHDALVVQENVAQNVLKSVHVGGFLQATTRKQNVEKRKLSNEYDWLTPSNKKLNKSFDQFAVETMIKDHQSGVSVTKNPLKENSNPERAAKSAPRPFNVHTCRSCIDYARHPRQERTRSTCEGVN
jgi:hypothetical protein